MFVVILRTLWTLPTTLVGLILGGVCTLLGSRWQFHTGVLECHGGAIAWLLENIPPIEGGAMALTLGDVVLGRSKAALDITRIHERVHVRQCHRWGPFFIPAYFLASGLAWLRKQDPYRQNPFEREAFAISDARQRTL